MDRAPPGAPPTDTMDAEETIHNVFSQLISTLRFLAMEPEAACEAQGNYNVAHLSFSRRHFRDAIWWIREGWIAQKRLRSTLSGQACLIYPSRRLCLLKDMNPMFAI